MTKMMANSPALLKGYLMLSGALSSGVLSAAVGERLALATAETNGCEYCLSAHTYIGANIANVDEQELDSARFAKSNDAHVQALLELSNAVLESRGAVSDDTLAHALAAGVTDAEVGEVVGHIALNVLNVLNVLTNYFNVLTQVDNDWPVVSPTNARAAEKSACNSAL